MCNLTDLEVPEQQRPDDLGDDVRLRWVPDYKSLYAVTEDGRAFSYHQFPGKPGPPFKMTLIDNGHGYSKINLRRNGEVERGPVHRLVLRCFEGPIPTPDHEARHLNGDPKDNRIENLAWGTKKENMEDRDRHGRTPIGESVPGAKLTPGDVIDIREAYSESNHTINDLADKYDAGYSTIRAILTGRTWSHVEGPRPLKRGAE